MVQLPARWSATSFPAQVYCIVLLVVLPGFFQQLVYASLLQGNLSLVSFRCILQKRDRDKTGGHVGERSRSLSLEVAYI